MTRYNKVKIANISLYAFVQITIRWDAHTTGFIVFGEMQDMRVRGEGKAPDQIDFDCLRPSHVGYRWH